MATRIKEKYLAEAVPALQQKFGYKNVMEIPKLDKIVINMGLGDCKDNAKAFEMAINELTTIAGQKPMVTKAKKSIANFKLREGQNIGAKVTLRGARMEEFMDKLVNIALPRVRDFRGVSDKAFDGRGNYALGIREQLLFPEIEYDKVEHIRGMEMIFVTALCPRGDDRRAEHGLCPHGASQGPDGKGGHLFPRVAQCAAADCDGHHRLVPDDFQRLGRR